MEWFRYPSDLDRATIIFTPGGSVASVLYPGEEERARLEYREAYQALEAERRADELRRAAIAERVKPFLAQGPSDLDGKAAEGLTPARSALVRALAWLSRTKRLAREAIGRNAAISEAARQRGVALASLEQLDAAVAASLAGWVRFGSAADAPDGRIEERAELVAELRESEHLAGVADQAAFEVSVAQGCIEAIEELLPSLRNAVLIESAGPLAERIRQHADDMQRAFGLLCALREATDGQGGVRQSKIDLPRLASGPCVISITPEQDDVAGWQQALADLEHDPLAEVRLLQAPTEPAEQPKSLRRRFLGGFK